MSMSPYGSCDTMLHEFRHQDWELVFGAETRQRRFHGSRMHLSDCCAFILGQRCLSRLVGCGDYREGVSKGFTAQEAFCWGERSCDFEAVNTFSLRETA